MERGVTGVHVPLPVRRFIPNHERRAPNRRGNRPVPQLLSLHHRYLQHRRLPRQEIKRKARAFEATTGGRRLK